MTENASSSSSQSGQSPEQDAGAPPQDERREWTTDELLGDQREVLIRHGDDLYRLRITRHGKLILYK